MASQYKLSEEQTQTLHEKFVPLFLNAPRAERKQKRKEILWDAVNAISSVGIDNATGDSKQGDFWDWMDADIRSRKLENSFITMDGKRKIPVYYST